MIYFLFGSETKRSKKKLTFTMRPNEIEELANFAGALKGEFGVLVNELELNKRDEHVRDVSAGFTVLCRKLNLMARKSV